MLYISLDFDNHEIHFHKYTDLCFVSLLQLVLVRLFAYALILMGQIMNRLLCCLHMFD